MADREKLYIDISLTRNYCINISIQTISSIHIFILKTQQFSHEQKGHCHFWPGPPKMIESTFCFPEFVSACKKSVYSICSVFEIQSISESRDQTGHTHFWLCPPNKFLISFYFLSLHEHAKNQFISSIHSSDTVNFRVLSHD